MSPLPDLPKNFHFTGDPTASQLPFQLTQPPSPIHPTPTPQPAISSAATKPVAGERDPAAGKVAAPSPSGATGGQDPGVGTRQSIVRWSLSKQPLSSYPGDPMGCYLVQPSRTLPPADPLDRVTGASHPHEQQGAYLSQKLAVASTPTTLSPMSSELGSPSQDYVAFSYTGYQGGLAKPVLPHISALDTISLDGESTPRSSQIWENPITTSPYSSATRRQLQETVQAYKLVIKESMKYSCPGIKRSFPFYLKRARQGLCALEVHPECVEEQAKACAIRLLYDGELGEEWLHQNDELWFTVDSLALDRAQELDQAIGEMHRLLDLGRSFTARKTADILRDSQSSQSTEASPKQTSDEQSRQKSMFDSSSDGGEDKEGTNPSGTKSVYKHHSI